LDGLYEDRWIRCDATTLVIRGYYFPLGTSKVIAYHDIREVTPIDIGTWTGKWRIWGASDPRYWWHLDWTRPQKDTALILELGRPVRPVITPDDPALVAGIIEDRRRPLG
jgi:hypothetical protein